VAKLADNELVERLGVLVSNRQQLTAELVIHMGEVDARKLYAREACSSMHTYATERLGMEDDRAYRHIRAARLGRQFPLALEMLREGKVHLTALTLLAPYLTEDNCGSLLGDAAGKSKRQLEQLLAERFPKPDVPSTIRKLPEPRSALPSESGQAVGSEPRPSADAPSSPKAEAVPPPPTGRDRGRVEPLSARRYKVQFTASELFVDKLEKAQALLKRAVPNGDVAAVLERALDLLVAEQFKRRFAATDKPRKSKPRSGARRSRYIPNDVKRAVVKRDGMRCTFVDAAGNRCSQTSGLELHHREPFARGGEAKVQDIARTHNRYQAEVDFGVQYVERRIQSKSRTRTGASGRVPPRGRTTAKAGRSSDGRGAPRGARCPQGNGSQDRSVDLEML